jgi:hypothetical protein
VDNLPTWALVRRTDPASVDGPSYQQWGSIAQDIAASLDLPAGDRLLIDAAEHEHPVKPLLAPPGGRRLGGAVRQSRPRSVAARAAAEHVTRIL